MLYIHHLYLNSKANAIYTLNIIYVCKEAENAEFKTISPTIANTMLYLVYFECENCSYFRFHEGGSISKSLLSNCLMTSSESLLDFQFNVR